MSSQQQPIASEFVADAEAAAPQVTSVNSSSVSVTRFSLPGSYLHPITENNPSQLLFINDNPMGVPGFIGGGLYGAYRGLQIAQGNSFNIRYNSVLNSIGRQGPRISNSLGVMTMGWGLLDNLFSSFRGGKSDYYNHVTAAFLSGALFKSTAGLRPALIAGGLMAAVVGGYGLSETFNSTSAKATVKSALPAVAPAPAAA
ncbi:hypothetical protein CcCBS67573_g01480 [Chytriomyces confervae]|uniref:Mitochondrial import inner membrane translocase subunit TIM23 n=1 Tax=Chytriomyces confervae TaxID=246404 RepID=A0A507FNJ4_9FUNG|nr:hypothetical protein CcCBS67573_g01480 [Chytriomyces confervae]